MVLGFGFRKGRLNKVIQPRKLKQKAPYLPTSTFSTLVLPNDELNMVLEPE